MKKLILSVFGLVAFYGHANAWTLFTEAPIKDVGTPVTIAVSSTTLTKVPSSQTSGRVGLYVHNPSTTAVVGFMGNCTSTALASTIRPIQFALTTAGTGPSGIQYFPLREDVCLWLLTLLTSSPSQNIHYQEVVK